VLMYKLRGWETISFWTRDTWSLVRSVQFQEGSRAKRPCRDLYAWFVSILGVTSRLWHQANCTEDPACPWCHYEWNVNLFQFVLPIPYHACLCLQISCMCEKMPASGAYSRPGPAVVPDRIASPCFASPWSWSGNGCRSNSDNLGSICSSFSQLYFFVAHSARFVFLFSGPANFSQPPGVSFSLRKQKKKDINWVYSLFSACIIYFSDLHSIFLYIYYSSAFMNNWKCWIFTVGNLTDNNFRDI